MIVISSNKIILKNIVPKIEVVEYNKIIFTLPIILMPWHENNVAIQVPANAKNDVGDNIV